MGSHFLTEACSIISHLVRELYSEMILHTHIQADSNHLTWSKRFDLLCVILCPNQAWKFYFTSPEQ